jgi:tetratricopeptide (TPR) repeat protein
MRRKIPFLVLGLLVGLVCGFKWANYSHRREQTAAVNAQAAQAAAKLNQPGGGNSLTPEQSQQAINEVKAVIDQARANPNDFDLQRRAADQFLQIQRPAGAVEFLSNAIRIKPDDVETMTRLAQAHFFAEKFDESVKWSRAALKRQPDSEAATYYLTAALIVSKQNLDEAERLIAQLAAKRGANDALLTELRERLGEARQAAGGAPPSQPQSKTMLQHGPDAGGVKK